jgi:hypothetical protein
VSINAEMGPGGRRVTDKGTDEATVVGRDERAPEPSTYDLRLELRRRRLKPRLLKSEDKKRVRDAGGRKEPA